MKVNNQRRFRQIFFAGKSQIASSSRRQRRDIEETKKKLYQFQRVFRYFCFVLQLHLSELPTKHRSDRCMDGGKSKWRAIVVMIEVLLYLIKGLRCFTPTASTKDSPTKLTAIARFEVLDHMRAPGIGRRYFSVFL